MMAAVAVFPFGPIFSFLHLKSFEILMTTISFRKEEVFFFARSDVLSDFILRALVRL